MAKSLHNPSLTLKQALFVEEYLIDLNASAAARRAGYSPKRADAIGFDLLRKAEIQEAIQAAQQERSARTGITADRVIAEIARIAFSDPRQVMEWGPHGVVVRDSSELTDADAAAVSEVSQTVTKEGGSMRVKMYNKLDALDKLCKHLGIYAAEKRILENPDGSGLFQSLSKEHRDAIVAAATRTKD